MRFNVKTSENQEIALIKRAINENADAINDLSESIQWLLDNALYLQEDGSVAIGDKVFTADMITAIYNAYKPKTLRIVSKSSMDGDLEFTDNGAKLAGILEVKGTHLPETISYTGSYWSTSDSDNIGESLSDINMTFDGELTAYESSFTVDE